MTKAKIELIDCKRGCGKKLHTLSRSTWHLKDEVRKKYYGICSECLTQTERNEMLDAIGKHIARKREVRNPPECE